MTQTLYGGRRARAIRASLFKKVNDGLALMGWYVTTGNFTPVTFIDEIPVFESNKAVAPNTVAIIDGMSESYDLELGSTNTEQRIDFTMELYAENDSVGLAIIKDIQAMLEGQLPPAGCYYPTIPLYDFTLATPVVVSFMDVEKIGSNRMSGPQPWMRYWYGLKFQLVSYQLDGDQYGSTGPIDGGTPPTYNAGPIGHLDGGGP